MSNEHEDAVKLKLESLSTKLADDSVEERVTSVCMRHAFMAIEMPERFVMAFVSDQEESRLRYSSSCHQS